MQNKAKFRKSQMNVNKVLTKDYEQKGTWLSGKKQSQTNPNKAKLKKAKMNVTSALTKAYENKPPIRAPKKQSQTSKRQKSIQTYLPQRIMKKPPFWTPKKQTQNKPKQTQFKRQRGGNCRRKLWFYCLCCFGSGVDVLYILIGEVLRLLSDVCAEIWMYGGEMQVSVLISRPRLVCCK